MTSPKPVLWDRVPDTGLEHDLGQYFDGLAQFESSREMESSELYRRIRPEVERVMSAVAHEQSVSQANPAHPFRRATAWNIERGTHLERILRVLREHERTQGSDVLFLTELDYGMARSQNRFVARELAQGLGMNYAFANCYISLVKGSGLEYDIEGENSFALHGNALLSRFPLHQVHRISLPNGKDKMGGKEKRLGYQQAVAAIVDDPRGPYWAISLHLDAHSTQRHRWQQMQLVLDHIDGLSPRLPVLIGGDWNTSTYNSSKAFYSILGYMRRVAMGVQYVVDFHYPYPEKWFERHLFSELEKRGYDYRGLNEIGVGTLHYRMDDHALNVNMGDWIPQWCFWFIRWAMARTRGSLSLKLDWFAGRGIKNHASSQPRVLSEVHSRQDPISDHDPIVLDFEFA